MSTINFSKSIAELIGLKFNEKRLFIINENQNSVAINCGLAFCGWAKVQFSNRNAPRNLDD